MAHRLARLAPTLLMLVVLAACGDQSFFMSSKNSSEDLQISSLPDGSVIQGGAALPVTVTSPGSVSGTDYEIDVTVLSSTGSAVWHNRTAVTINEQMQLPLPAALASGQYRADWILFSAGESVQKKSVSFFIAETGWKVTAIKSFPLVISSSATIMLKAELGVPPGANPWLRWSWKGRSLAKGALADGLDTILWVTPADSGVYTVTLELFPFAPAVGGDYAFSSTLALSTDIVVSGGTAAGASDLGADSSFLSLLRLQATLDDTGTGAHKNGKTRAVSIGKPAIVAQDDCFGYRLDASSGIQIPWFAFPMDGGVLKPFTLSLRVSLADHAAAGTLVRASTADGGFQLSLAMDPQTGGPAATLTVAGSPAIVIPWTGPALVDGQRSLLSLSIVPLGSTLTAQWFLDGEQVGARSVSCKLPPLTQSGTVTIGGDQGFAGIVDEFGVYAQDPAGRPAPDPDLYSRAQKKLLGARVVLADGFDGINLGTGFVVKGQGQLAAGSLLLSPGASLALPPVKVEGAPLSLSADLSADSARSAVLVASWEGGASPEQSIPVTADKTGLHFSLAADGRTITVLTAKGETAVTLPAAEDDAAHLVITIQNLAEAGSPLVLTKLLVTKDQG
jgi:hypothetical protein